MTFYKQDGTELLDVEVDDESYRYREIMGDDTLTLYFSLAEHTEIPIGAYVKFQNRAYTLMRPEALKMVHTRNFEYTVTLEADQAKAKIWKFRCVYSDEDKAHLTDGRLKFTLTAAPKEHLQMFVDNMNRRDSGWTVGECVSDVEKCISYDHAYCWDALGQMADTFGTEFEISGKQVSLCKVEYYKAYPLPLSYGKGNGFTSGVERTNYEDKPPVEILYAQGGTDNIDASKYGASELHLPKGGTIAYDGRRFEDEEGYDETAARKYVADDMGYSVSRADGEVVSMAEDSLDCSSIYPHRVGTVTEVICVDEGGNLYDFTDSNIPGNLDYSECLIAGQTMTVQFQSGMLAGKSFDVAYTHFAVGSKKARRFEIVPQEIDGVTMPNATYIPAKGDTYAVFGCSLPDAYINAYKTEGDTKSGAEWDMMRKAVQYMYDNETENFSFSGKLDGIYAKNNWTDVRPHVCLGGYILFTDDRFQKEGVRIRIINIKEYINNPYAPEIELSNSTVSGSFSNTLQELTSAEVLNEERTRDAIQFTKRRFRDAKETLAMIEAALLDNFTKSVQPVTVQTMAMLVGDESLQFRYVDGTESPKQVDAVFTYDSTFKKLRCPEGIIQHMTLGISSVSAEHKASEYRFWSIPSYNSGTLADGERKYYLYAKVAKSADVDTDTGQTIPAGTYFLSETALKMEEDGDTERYNLLVGILNSEYDGDRSFAPLYGFTEILPGRVTTDRIVSSEGTSYFDLVNNAMKLGDALDFNSAGDGTLRLKGTIVQSQSGATNYLGCFRGAFYSGVTYYKGDEVTYEANGCTSTYRYIYATPASGILPTVSTHWQVVAQGSQGEQGDPGEPGISPNTAFKSTVFVRSNSTPTTPGGGTYASPVPDGWSDGVPSGEQKLWASTRIFSSDGKDPQQSAWTTPRQMTDTADFDVEFSSVAAPNPPSGHPNTNTQWSDKADESTVWMATSRKNNGSWSDWQIAKIKGENGTDGTSVSIKATAYAHYATADEWTKDTAKPLVLIDQETVTESGTETTYYRVAKRYKNTGTARGWVTIYAEVGDGYLMSSDDTALDGCLYVAIDDGWQNVGVIKGDKGESGTDGDSAYVHIKYANSLTEDDWTENEGETPGAYIGVYADHDPTDQLVWTLYQWTKWKGEDGNGYEYIYRRTATSTAPTTPTETSQDDDYVPDGWTDNPTGVDATHMYEWICYRRKTAGVWGAFIGSHADTTKAALWAKYGQTGSQGYQGDYTELRYAKNGSTTDAPTLDKTADEPEGWTLTIPTPYVSVGEYLWFTSGKKTWDGRLKTEWTTPTRLTGVKGDKGEPGEKGDDGKSPAMVYRGEYDSTKTYYGNANRLDCVHSGDTYYIARIDAGEFVGIAPPDTSRWNAFGASLESVATELLLAENANIAGWIFRDGKLESQKQDESGNPMAYLDGVNGELRLNGTVQHSTDIFEIGGTMDADVVTLDEIKADDKTVNLSTTKRDIGRRCLLVNRSTPASGICYKVKSPKYGWDDKGNYYEVNSEYYVIPPGTALEMACSRLPSGAIIESSKGDYKVTEGGNWEVTSRMYNDIPTAVAMGIVTNTTATAAGAAINAESLFGADFSVTRNGTSKTDGLYTVTMPAMFKNLKDPVVVSLTGIGYSQDEEGKKSPVKATLISRSGNTFTVAVSDDDTQNGGSFSFVVYSFGGWNI